MKKNVRKYNRSGVAWCPICQQQTLLVCHHIKGREIPNCDDKSNILWCCPNDHDRIHSGLIDIHGWAMTSKGRELLYQVL